MQTCLCDQVEFRLLGPVEVRLDGRTLSLGGPKPRALLVILLLEANKPVSRDRLIDGLWGERAPPTAQRSLDTYISRLRSLLGPDRIVRRPPGYLVRVEDGELDLDRFDALLEQARAAILSGDSVSAAEVLNAALALWRGPALADLLHEPFAQLEAARLEERRLLALEECIAARLALGQTRELVPELEVLVREQPFRERPLGQLMLALYRSGRQAEALAAYQAGRRRLAEELGLEPAPELRELQRKILEQDPELELARSARADVEQPPRMMRRPLVAAAGAAVAATAVVVGIVLGLGGTSASTSAADSSQVVGLNLDSGSVLRAVPLDDAPAAMAAGNGSLWLADPNDGTVSRLDFAGTSVVDRVPVGGSPGALAIGGGSVWVASVPGEKVTRIDPSTGRVTQTIRLGGARASALAFGTGGLWIADITDNTLIELDASSGSVRRTLALHLTPTAVAIGGGFIWAADYDANTLAQIDLRTGETVANIHVGNGPVALAEGAGFLWVANSLDSTVSKVDPTSGSVAATIPVGSGPSALAVADSSVWVANQHSGTVSRIDPDHNAVAKTVSVGGGPTVLIVAGRRIWVGVRAIVRRRGGTLTLLHTRPISIDPALHLDLLPPVADGLTRDGLVTYNHVSGPAGIQLVPDLAFNLPVPTDGGRTYTFRLRPGIRYSDGRLVRAADFRRAIERVFRLHSGGADLLAAIAGADACRAPGANACDLSRGIVTGESSRTVTFHLRAADSGFLANLTVAGLAAPVPPGTPFHDVGFAPIPGTGPYKIASASEHEIHYVRNTRFHEWSHAAQPDGNPDEIVMRFGLSAEQEVQEIQAGRADWMNEAIPPSLLPGLARRFAGQVHPNATTETDFFKLDTTLPPFDDVRVRRALNLAVDRETVVRVYGGRKAATATCQVLPPGIRGYRPYCPYTRNLPAARQLVAASGTRGARVTVWGWTDDPTIRPAVVRHVADVLRELGYRVRVRLVPHSFFNDPSSVPGAIQLIPAGWLDTSAYSFVAPWLSCQGAINRGAFCSPQVDRQMRRALSLEETDPRAAAALWAKIDRELVDQAVWVPLVNPRVIDFVSSRVRNYQYHPYWGILADQLSLR